MTMIENMLKYSEDLKNALISGNDQNLIKNLQRIFTESVINAMSEFKKGNIEVDVETLPIVMFNWVTKELPIKILDKDNFKKIIDELVLFNITILKILNPKEKL